MIRYHLLCHVNDSTLTTAAVLAAFTAAIVGGLGATIGPLLASVGGLIATLVALGLMLTLTVRRSRLSIDGTQPTNH